MFEATELIQKKIKQMKIDPKKIEEIDPRKSDINFNFFDRQRVDRRKQK